MRTDKTSVRPEWRPSSGYQIRVRGTLDEHWSTWFDGIELTVELSDNHQPLTTLNCLAIDQAQLRGVLNKIWDLNLILVSVTPIQGVERD
jgi:hypothetical protein